ncbi:MAG: hypothetical protein RBS16_10110 [Candidatus Cloacimonadales bacterium]|jgi:hypothetical protein|nr:hypothetical protein [Candidatus Cloacimonadota bacterium]MDX9978366.1 hypothetical protein [Candidatus Cloacimonadales bacterium]HPY97364.1 hypothetical protein [Candidatus Cloacimonadota bacterium]HQB40324.1 hypothetical protein [Candidatus Cloacimonadota bacterium]
MKKSLIVLIIVVFAICLLSADTVTVQASRDIPGQIRGYVYQSYYPNHSSIPQWKAKAGELVLIKVIHRKNPQLNRTYSLQTGSDGFYTTPVADYFDPADYSTVTVTCHGVSRTESVQNVNRFDFYIDREF